MERIGIRELRQHASRWVRRAAAGKSFEVTDRGTPLARLAPLAPLEGIEKLRAEGRITEPRGDLLEHAPLIPPKPGSLLPSETLSLMRRAER